MEEFTIADLEGRRIWERLGRRAARSLKEKQCVVRRTEPNINVGKIISYKEAPIECLSSLAFDSIMCGTPLSGVGPSRRFALALRIG